MKPNHRFLLIALLALLPLCNTAQLITRTFTHNAGIRKYDLELPSSWQAGDSLPLVLDLHYLGGDARDEDTLTRFFPVADTAGFIICHPWGQGTNWNAGFNAPYTAGPADVDFIRVVIDSIAAEFGVDRRRVYATGMGQGGFMVHRLACELSDKIAAVAAVGASIPDSAAFYCANNRPVPIMMIHGRADSVIKWPGEPGLWPGIDDLVDFWGTRNNCSSAPTITNLPDLVNEGSTITSHHYACGGSSEVILYEVINGGSAWPGAIDSLPNSGIINQDINAAVEIWNFFRRHAIDPLASHSAETAENELDLEIWPQPAGEELSFRLKRVSATEWEVVDWHGRIMERGKTFGGHETRLSLAELAPGSYVLRVHNRFGSVKRRFVRLPSR
ncbi:MAG: PHB depolymerase family esterase [Bacteroidota bacterium]